MYQEFTVTVAYCVHVRSVAVFKAMNECVRHEEHRVQYYLLD